MRVREGGPVTGGLLKEGPVRAFGKPRRSSEAYIPEPDPHDLCLTGSEDVSSPFVCDEAVRPPGRGGFPALDTGPPDLSMGGGS